MLSTWFRKLMSRPLKSTPRKHKPARNSQPTVELLERRELLANLSMSNAFLVNNLGNRVDSPAIGMLASARVEFDATDLPANSKYAVDVSIDGETITNTLDWAAGLSGTYNLVYTPRTWPIRPGPHTLRITLDATNSIAEDDEADNSFSLPFTALALSPRFLTPIGGIPFKDWTVVNYLDSDPTSARADYLGGPYTYNGHTGLDLTLPNFAAMDRGVDVYAAASGTVIEVHDGEFDRNTGSGTENPVANRVIIDHGGGLKTLYWHLRKNSVAVSVGQVVNAGVKIGQVGSSGTSSDAHLHFEVQYRDTPVETYFDPTNYWLNPLPYARTVPGTLDLGTTNHFPTTAELKERPQETEVFSQTAGQTVYFWVNFHGIRATDTFGFDWRKPDGSLFKSDTLTGAEVSYGWWLNSATFSTVPEVGTWQVCLTHNGSALSCDTFTVMDAPLSATGAGNVVAAEGTPVSGVVASFSDPLPGVKAADYSATITWGDGHVSQGTIAAKPSGGFDVTGTNRFADNGSYTVSTEIRHFDGRIVTATGHVSISSVAPTATFSNSGLVERGKPVTVFFSNDQRSPITGLFATGVDDNGLSWPNGAEDPHYKLSSSADPSLPGPAAFAVNQGWPLKPDGPWLANSSTSRWIAPQAGHAASAAPGNYVYRTAFDLTGFDPTTVQINGQWTSDDEGLEIRLNQASTGISHPGNEFGTFHPFDMSTGFMAGVNNLEFVVRNGGGPTGLRTELSGTARAPALDPSAADIRAGFTYSYDWNNDGDFSDPGEAEDVSSASRSFTFGEAGIYPVRGRVKDKDGTYTDYVTTVLVNSPAFRIGSAGSDVGNALTLDTAGNIYVTGLFENTVDFDTSAATLNLTSAGNIDVFVAKFSSAGALVWARAMGGAAQDVGTGIKVDSTGSVYTTGLFQGMADFDPGPSTFSLTSAGGEDTFVSKLDASGGFVWARRAGGAGVDRPKGITIDAAQNVVVAGAFIGTSDFDPGPGTFDLTSSSSSKPDTFVWKLDTAGNLVWARNIGGEAYGLAADSTSNVYITGGFYGTCDFDPGSATFNLTSVGDPQDVFVSKLNSNGNFVWARAWGGPRGDQGKGIAVDSSGNVSITGTFDGTADFDPGAGVVNLTSAGQWDVFVSKLSTSGNFMWARALGGPGWDEGYSIAVDTVGNVYTTGHFAGTVDFDPGADTFNLTSAGNGDIFLSKLDSTGSFVSAQGFGGSGYDLGVAIAVNGSGRIYSTGYFAGTADFDPAAGTFNLTSAGLEEMFVTLGLSMSPPALTISDVTVTEGNGGSVNAVFTVALSTPSSNIVTVDYATANGTGSSAAVSGSDYVAKFGKLTFDPGSPLKQTITVSVLGDLLDEVNESFVVNLSNATSATIGDNQGVATIVDDDEPPSVSFVASSSTSSETTTAIPLTVSLSAPSGKLVTVDYAGTGTATGGVDYSLPPGPLTFNPGDTSKTIMLTVADDSIPEDSETIQVKLSSPVNASLGASSAYTHTILDNERIFWVGSNYGYWAIPTNWSLGAVPTASQEVVINATSTTTVIVDSGNNFAKKLNTSSGVVLAVSAPLSIADTSVVSHVSLFSGYGYSGKLEVNGDLTLNKLQWEGGIMSGSGVTRTNILTIGGYDPCQLVGRTLETYYSATYNTYPNHTITLTNASFNNMAAVPLDVPDATNLFIGVGRFNNAGTLRKQTGTGVTTIGVDFNNTGTVAVQAGTLSLTGSFTNFSGTTLSGGAYQVIGSGRLMFNNADIRTNAASITLDGTASRIVNQAGANALAYLATNAPGSSLTLAGGRDLSTGGAFTNAGSVTLNSGSELAVAGNYIQTAGLTNLLGGELDPATGYVATIQAGTVSGFGTISADMTNAGQVIVGGVGGTGILYVTRSYAQTPTGSLHIEIGGTTYGTQYDRLRVGGKATLDGSMFVSSVNGFQPALGNSFKVLTYGSRDPAKDDTFRSRIVVDPIIIRRLNAVFSSSGLTLDTI